MKKGHLVPAVTRIGEITRGIFDEDAAAEPVLHAADLAHEMIERGVDIGHKAVYSCVTGMVADRWIAPRLQSRRGTTSH